jgi:hypothetical protein
MNNMQAQQKPLIVPFYKLAGAFQSLHRWEKAHLSNLHDIWMKGAPAPGSIIRNPRGYDPRMPQAGNYEARIVLPGLLSKWIIENANRLSVKMDDTTARQLIDSVARILQG